MIAVIIKRELDATIGDVSGFTKEVDQHLGGLSVNDRTTLVLALQELLVNIVKHAYAGKVGTIDFEMQHRGDEITVDVQEYSASSFTLDENIAAPDPLALPESGMGLFIIQQSFDSVNYSQDDGVNRWQLVKRLEA